MVNPGLGYPDWSYAAAKNGIVTSRIADDVERHRVPGGGSRTIRVQAGDGVAIVNPEGQQRAEFTVVDHQGVADTGFVDAEAGAGQLARTLARVEAVRLPLERLGLDWSRLPSYGLFDADTPAASRSEFTVQRDGWLVVAAPGAPMRPEHQDTPTDIIVFIRRQSRRQGERLAPPAPLFDPLIDHNIQPGQAYTYEVKAGQWIQILDVQGRECSDFQAFSQRALDRGLEREIDPTTTRSLTGRGYPAPGLSAKFWSVDHEALAEVVQDTCGRHDSFGLACTARYYEDLGYPGHINCSDNMNRELAQHGVRARGGWPAINFFFNTSIDEANAVGMDDPWSRPGDYVMLQALTDLVCVSTGCPCDVDPANGWNPTDIQVRVYDSKARFKRSIGYRKTAESPVEHTIETGFHAAFAAHARDFVEYNGYWLAAEMNQTGAVGEYWACREKVAIMDLSPLRKVEVTGPDAEALMQYCVTRNMKKLDVGQVVYTAMCYEHGGMIDDGTVYRLGADNFRWVGGCDSSGLWLREQAVKLGLNAWVRNSTSQLCNVAVQGPLSRAMLQKVFWTPPQQPTIEELGWFRFSIARIGDFHGAACVVSRTGYSGELGYEVFCHPKDAQTVWDALWEAGEPLGLQPLGLNALDMLRIEAGLIFAGYEFSDQTDPFEAGIGFAVPLKSKTDDFCGREALLRRKAHPQKKLVGLDIEGGVVPVSGDCVRIGRAQVGEITSAVRSPILGKVIALCRIDIAHSELGTEVEVGQLDGMQKRLSAQVVGLSHFDPGKKRVRGEYGD